MADPDPGVPPKEPAVVAMENAVDQIREVTKWLIAAFAAVGVILAAGSQLSEVGDLSGLRLAVAFVAVVVAITGIAAAIFFATRVLTPEVASLQSIVGDEAQSQLGKDVAADPGLLQGHGTTLKEFDQNRKRAIAAEDEAWARYDASSEDDKKPLALGVKRAEAERGRFDSTLSWILSYALFLDVSRRFRGALIAMFVGSALAAFGIAGFAWAAHPGKDGDEPTAAVPAAPVEVHVDLSYAGKQSLKASVGGNCDTDSMRALAVGGPPSAVEMISVPTDSCALHRFVLTPVLGTYIAVPSEPPTSG